MANDSPNVILPPLILFCLCLLVFVLAVKRAPYGYEDADGFHFGAPKANASEKTDDEAPFELVEAEWVTPSAEAEWVSLDEKEEMASAKSSSCTR